MKRSLFSCVGLLAFASIANAHFQLQFPPPRGPFVEAQEGNFCDGYTNVASNRSEFPLSNGFITLNSEHVTWTATVLIATDQNPNNFTLFNTTSNGTILPPAVPFFKVLNHTGAACILVDIQSLNISGVGDGSNVSLLVRYNGGDGDLFQCTDLTLFSNFTIPSSDNCTGLVNTTASGTPKKASAVQIIPGSSWVSALTLAAAALFL